MRRWLKEFFMSSLDRMKMEKLFPTSPKVVTTA